MSEVNLQYFALKSIGLVHKYNGSMESAEYTGTIYAARMEKPGFLGVAFTKNPSRLGQIVSETLNGDVLIGASNKIPSGKACGNLVDSGELPMMLNSNEENRFLNELKK